MTIKSAILRAVVTAAAERLVAKSPGSSEPHWLSDMSEGTRKAYFAEHPHSKYNPDNVDDGDAEGQRKGPGTTKQNSKGSKGDIERSYGTSNDSAKVVHHHLADALGVSNKKLIDTVDSMPEGINKRFIQESLQEAGDIFDDHGADSKKYQNRLNSLKGSIERLMSGKNGASKKRTAKNQGRPAGKASR